ncbi:Catechol-2,3-dioxygenase [compost metagenome]
MNLIQRKKQLDGASDHWVSEALYLSDPDDNGIEVYVDRPSDTWKRNSEGAPLMATEALDLQALLDAHSHEVWSGLPTGTTIGHIHLHVADLKQAQAFYCDVLGFELIAAYGSQALFVSAGRYHHHIGLNVWAGVGVPPQSAHSVGLKHYEIVIPDLKELTKLVDRLAAAGIQMQQQNGHLFVQDPSGNSIVFVIKK